MSVSAIIFTLACKKGDIERDSGLTTPENIERFDNIQYGKNKKWNVLDVYRPKSVQETENQVAPSIPLSPLPVIVNFHGGGWVYGDKELYQFYCMRLAQSGFAVVNFTYRLAPRYKFPSPLQDMNSVMEFIFENAEKFGFDTHHIFFAGDSAGAHLASLYTEFCICPELMKNELFPNGLGFEPKREFIPKALLLNCGMYDVFYSMNLPRQDDGGVSFISKNVMKDFCGKKMRCGKISDGTVKADAMYKFISPVNHITKDFPPCFVMSANQDFLHEQYPFLIAQLEKNGVKHEKRFYGTDEKPLTHVFHLNMKSEDAEICNQEEIEFLRQWV